MIQQQMFKDKTPAERHEMLETNCEKIEEVSYMKTFNEDELRQRKDSLPKPQFALLTLRKTSRTISRLKTRN